MGTPYMWRTFTNAALTAREGQLDQFLLQNWHSICIRGNTQHRAKNRGKPPKNTDFSTFSDHLVEFGLICCTAYQARPDSLRNLICCTTFQVWPDLLRNVSGQTQPDSQGSSIKHAFWSVFARFLPCSLHFVHL